MRNFSYTKSVQLMQEITLLDSYRKELLLYPLPPRVEHALQYSAREKRTAELLAINNQQVDVQTVSKFLSTNEKRTKSPLDPLLDTANRALAVLHYEWTNVSRPLEVGDIELLYHTLFQKVLSCDTKELQSALDYVQSNPEHPVIQAALLHAFVSDIFSNIQDGGYFAPILGNLILSKSGYAFRRLVGSESAFFNHLSEYQTHLLRLKSENDMSFWLEFVTKTLSAELKITLDSLQRTRNELQDQNDSINTLSDRQQAIVGLYIRPGMRLTNRQIQRTFKVSQITASRDLATLSQRGLLFPVGKGRSTSYMKV